MTPINSLAALYRATWRDCLRLCIVASVALSMGGLVLLPYRDEVLYGSLEVFIPVDWLSSIQLANEALFHKLGGVLLFQTVAIVCFTAVSVFFFPFRERISLKAEACLTGQPAVASSGLKREAWHELGLVLIAFNAYSCVYLLAYAIGEPLFAFIDVLAFALLALFFVLDLLSPVFFRRGLNSWYVIKAWPHLPLKLLLFGLVFCSPIYALELFLGDLVYVQDDEIVLAVAVVVIIVVNCVVCIFALPLGTWLALQAMDESDPPTQALPFSAENLSFFALQLTIAALLLTFYAGVVNVVLSKVPLKTATFSVDWFSLDYTSGSSGEPPRLSFSMEIHNHHETLGLQIDDADLLLNLEGRYLGEAGLHIPHVPPQTSAVVPVELQLRVDFSEAAGIAWQEVTGYFADSPPAWRDDIQARLDVRLPFGMKLPVYLTQGYRHAFEER